MLEAAHLRLLPLAPQSKVLFFETSVFVPCTSHQPASLSQERVCFPLHAAKGTTAKVANWNSVQQESIVRHRCCRMCIVRQYILNLFFLKLQLNNFLIFQVLWNGTLPHHNNDACSLISQSRRKHLASVPEKRSANFQSRLLCSCSKCRNNSPLGIRSCQKTCPVKGRITRTFALILETQNPTSKTLF